MSLEATLANWTGPSSATEQDKQERTERMIREAVAAHRPFAGCGLSIYAKGSYANNTNVRTDSDVDIAVQCTDVEYWEEAEPGTHSPGAPYTGIWTPEKLRSELVAALQAKFPGQVDTSGSVAIQVNSSTARVDADVVPCFTYRYYFSSGGSREGAKIFSKAGDVIDNYPAQQLENGNAKNLRTGYAYKKAVRILKRVENAVAFEGKHRELPSYFVECLAYNCPDALFRRPMWTDVIRECLVHIWEELQGAEPIDSEARWLEANGCFYLFHGSQKWTRAYAREFSHAAWNYLGFGS
jgi:hypothetical protein